MAEYPKRLTEVFKTSDGKFFETEGEAQSHESRYAIEMAVRQSVYSFAGISTYSRDFDVGGLVDRLVTIGYALHPEKTYSSAAWTGR